MKLFFTLFALLFISFNGFGQTAKIDSLLNIINSKVNDTIKLNAYKDIITYYIGNDLKEAERRCEEYRKIAFKRNLSKYEINYFVLKGNIEFKSGNISNAKEIYKEGLRHKEIDKYFYPKVSLLNNIATSFGSNESDSALKYINKAIDLNKKGNNKEGLLHNFSFLSSFYQNKGDFANAIAYLDMTMKLAIEENNQKIIAQTHINLAGLDRGQYDYKSSVDHFQKAREIFELIEPENKLMLSMIDYEIGATFIIQKEYKKSINYFLNYKIIYQNEMIPPILFDIIDMRLLQSYIQLKNFKEAEGYYEKLKEKDLTSSGISDQISLLGYLSQYEFNFNKISSKTYQRLEAAQKMAYETKSAGVISFVSQILAQYYAKVGEYKLAYSELLKHQDYLDTIKNIENKVISLAMDRKLKVASKDRENLQLKKEKAEQQLQLTKENRNKWLLSGGLIGSLAVLGVVGFSYQRNRKQKKQIENLQKELHHRVKNNLSIIDTFIEVVKKELPDAKAQGKLNELQNRIISINEVHRQLYNSKNITSLYLKKYIDTLAENVSQSFDKPEIELKTEIPETVVLGAERSFPVGLIVNEFLTNSYKYAFENNGTGKIWVSLKEKGNSFLLSLSDNGKGLPAGFDVKETDSFGLRIIKLLTEQLNGNFSMKGDDGVSLEIEFPKT